MNTILRDEAVAHVEKEWAAGKPQGQQDALKIIDEQDNEDEPLVEGSEGVEYEVVEDDGAASENEVGDDELIPTDAPEQADAVVEDDSVADPEVFDVGDSEGAQPMLESAHPPREHLAPAEDAPTEEQALACQQLLAKYYAGKNNEVAYRRITEEMRNTARDRSTEENKIIKVLREVQHEVD